MKTFESVDRVTHMMQGAQQTIARLSNELNSISDATFKGTSQEELKDLHRKLNRLVNHDMRDFINKCISMQLDILHATNRIYDFIDWGDEDGD